MSKLQDWVQRKYFKETESKKAYIVVLIKDKRSKILRCFHNTTLCMIISKIMAFSLMFLVQGYYRPSEDHIAVYFCLMMKMSEMT